MVFMIKIKAKLTQKLPEKFLDRLEKIIPVAKKENVMGSFVTYRPTTFRTNLLKISTNELEKELRKRSINFRKVEWYEDAFILGGLEQKEFTNTDLYQEGLFYIQSISSMIPALVLDPRPEEKILDLTAAPGSKTTQIAMLMKNRGEIVANDKSKIRNFKLSANLKTQGVKNAKIENMPGQILWKKYPEYFDKTLVDVPCSMEGRININDEKSFLDWSIKKIHYLEEVQKFLLRSAVSATKPGGIIVYSTCTLAPEENEGVIDWILKREKGRVIVEEISLTLSEKSAALQHWQTKSFDDQVKKTVRILPSQLMEGFYLAKLRKTSSTILNMSRLV